MKVLNLVWSEFACDYHAEQFLFGDDNSPPPAVMIGMIKDKFPNGRLCGDDIHLSANNSRQGDELYKEILAYCKNNGYTTYEVPEITVNIS